METRISGRIRSFSTRDEDLPQPGDIGRAGGEQQGERDAEQQADGDRIELAQGHRRFLRSDRNVRSLMVAR